MQKRTCGLFLVHIVLTSHLFAHHGHSASYDVTRKVTLPGKITQFKYINPHPTLLWDVKNEQGTLTHWVGEIPPSPVQLNQSGWGKKRSESALAPGTQVFITICPSRTEVSAGLVLRIESIGGEAILGDMGLGNSRSPAVEPRR